MCSALSNLQAKLGKMARSMMPLRNVERIIRGMETSPFKRALKHGVAPEEDCCLSVIASDIQDPNKIHTMDLEFQDVEERDMYVNGM